MLDMRGGMRVLRWALVPVSALAVWYAVLLIGIGAVSVLDAMCPPELVVSGACTAPWHGPAVEALFVVCAALAALGIVTVTALVAPTHKRAVASAAFACGAAFAVYVARAGDLWAPFLAAALGGAVGLWIRSARSRRNSVARLI